MNAQIKNQRQNSSGGFSLVELIIVIAIVAVLSVMVSVSMGTQKLTAAATRLAYDLRYSQQLAISRQVSCGASFDPAANSYFVYINNLSTKATDPLTKEELNLDYDDTAEYSGIDLVSSNFGDRISFDSLGAPYNSSGIALSASGTLSLAYRGAAKTIIITPNTGAVKIQ